ncbi:MAG: gliding motility-associated-like protein [Bacteroidia bacterium]
MQLTNVKITQTGTQLLFVLIEMKLRLILLYFLSAWMILSEEANAQIAISTTKPVITSCQESDSIIVVLTTTTTTTTTNTTTSASLDSIEYQPSLPTNVHYVVSSMRMFSEENKSNLNQPIFRFSNSLSAGSSLRFSYVLRGGCSLDDQYPLITHILNAYSRSLSTNLTQIDTIPTFITPDLSLISQTVTGGFYTNIGDTFQLNLMVGNNAFASVESFQLKLVTGNSIVPLTIRGASLSVSNDTATYLFSNSKTSKSNLISGIPLRMDGCNNHTLKIILPWGCTSNLCNTIHKNMGSVKKIDNANLQTNTSILGANAADVSSCKSDTVRYNCKNTSTEPNIVGSGTLCNLVLGFAIYNQAKFKANGIARYSHLIIGTTTFNFDTLQAIRSNRMELNNLFTSDPDGDRGLMDADGEEEVVVYPNDGSYITTLIATNQYGCADTSISFDSITTNRKLFIANSFSPNNDGNNDDFGIRVNGSVNGYELIISNRWGEQIMVTNDPEERWVGAYMGEDVARRHVFLHLVCGSRWRNNCFKKGLNTSITIKKLVTRWHKKSPERVR